jgi:dTMP kinase
LLDLPVALGLERAGRRSAPDRFESQTMAFFERVRAGYLALAAASPERYRVIDAAGSQETVATAVTEAIDGFLDQRL